MTRASVIELSSMASFPKVWGGAGQSLVSFCRVCCTKYTIYGYMLLSQCRAGLKLAIRTIGIYIFLVTGRHTTPPGGVKGRLFSFHGIDSLFQASCDTCTASCSSTVERADCTQTYRSGQKDRTNRIRTASHLLPEQAAGIGRWETIYAEHLLQRYHPPLRMRSEDAGGGLCRGWPV